jgi:hypothetical protein
MYKFFRGGSRLRLSSRAYDSVPRCVPGTAITGHESLSFDLTPVHNISINKIRYLLRQGRLCGAFWVFLV